MMEFILETLLTPNRVWLGTILGVVAAICFWNFLPESMGRDVFAMGSVVLGFLAGLIFSFPKDNK